MIQAVVGDLASVAADAVVRPATTWLEPLTPALRHLDEAAGPFFQEQCRVRRELAVGSAVVTGGGALPAEFVVHAVLGAGEADAGAETVRRATEAALWQCAQWQIETLACPLPPGDTFDVMIRTLRARMRNASHPANVLFIVATPAEADTLNARLGQDSH